MPGTTNPKKPDMNPFPYDILGNGIMLIPYGCSWHASKKQSATPAKCHLMFEKEADVQWGSIHTC